MYPSTKLMNPDTMKLPAVVQQTVDATALAENNHPTPTALGPQLEDPPKVATARATLVVAAVALVAAMATAGVAVAGARHMVLAEELAAAAVIAEAEATRTAMSPAIHVAATIPATKSRRFVANWPLKKMAVMASPPSPLDFTTCSSRKNSSLSGSPSTTLSKTEFSGFGVVPYPLKTLVATMT
jgi:hypothetical protein